MQTSKEIGIALIVVVGCAASFGACVAAHSQPVTPPIQQPPPVFNPSYPYTVPQPPYKPISPKAVAVSAQTAHAYGFPWCLQSSAYLGGQDCSYATLRQCLVDRQGLGGFCGQNPEISMAVIRLTIWLEDWQTEKTRPMMLARGS